MRAMQMQLRAPSVLARRARIGYVANTRSTSFCLFVGPTAPLRSQWFGTRNNTGIARRVDRH